MFISQQKLKILILEVMQEEERLDELDIEQLSDVCYGSDLRSTHALATCKYNNDEYFLKFSESWSIKKDDDEVLQPIVEFLAYKIYSLFPDVMIPEDIHLVSDKKNKRIGLATYRVAGITGRSAVSSGVDFFKSLSGGAMVDIFIANWDVANLSNMIVDLETGKATRIDPGGALTYRARGGRKGEKFSREAPELKTMLGGGTILQKTDLVKACRDFIAVDWATISETIDDTLEYAKQVLPPAGLESKIFALEKEFNEIKSILSSRYSMVYKHCQHVLDQEQENG